jgi:hypothetical protein
MLGTCTGALATAAVGSCRGISELLVVGPHTVGIAFRTGLRAVAAGRSIERPEGPVPAPWSITIPGLSPEAARASMDEFLSHRVS